jgi:hypothetical protein
MDDLLGEAQHLAKRPGVTAKLEVKYRDATPLDEELRLEAWVHEERERRTIIHGTCHTRDRLTVEATGLFIAVDFEAMHSRMRERWTPRPLPSPRFEETAVKITLDIQDAPFESSMTETRMGMLLPPWALELLKARINPTNFVPVVTQSKVYDPGAAASAGFLDEIVAEGEAIQKALEAAAGFAALPEKAYGANKLCTRTTGIEVMKADLGL